MVVDKGSGSLTFVRVFRKGKRCASVPLSYPQPYYPHPFVRAPLASANLGG